LGYFVALEGEGCYDFSMSSNGQLGGGELMAFLQEWEWIRLNNLILTMQEELDEQAMRHLVLTGLRELIPYDKGDFYLIDCHSNDQCLHSPVAVDVEKRFLKEYEEYYAQVDYAKWVFTQCQPLVYQDTAIIDARIRWESEFMQDYLEPMGVFYPAGVAIHSQGSNLGALTLFRSKSMGDFNQRDLFILEQLNAHIGNRLWRDSQKHNIREVSYKDKAWIVLTEREREVVQMVGGGLSNAEISQRLFLSQFTVKTHLKNIYTKLGINSRTQLINLLFLQEN